MHKRFHLGFFAFASLCLGDTLTLKNGDTLEGTYLGGTARVLRMEVNGRVQTFDISMVNGLQFSNGPGSGQASPADYPPPASSRSSAPPPRGDQPVLRRAPDSGGDNPNYSSSAQPPAPPPLQSGGADSDRPVLRRSPQSGGDDGKILRPDDPYSSSTAAPSQPQQIEIPAGTNLTVRMIDSVDSQVARVGDTFRASLDEPVSMNGQIVIPRGADVVAKLVEDDKSGKISGRTVLKLVLADIKVNDRMVDITTSDVVKESSSRGARSGGVIGGGAALGAIIGAVAGGGKGAAIGAGSGAAAGTGAEVLGKGQRVKVPSETRLDFTLSYAVRI